MAQNLILSVRDATVTFGGKPLFHELSFNIHEGDRICLVGRNGSPWLKCMAEKVQESLKPSVPAFSLCF